MIIEIINHFFENIIIEENKYINNIKNIMWDKNNDITKFLDHIKSDLLKQNKKTNIQINNFFNIYCKFCKENKINFTVNKICFEKFIYENLSTYIVDKTIKKEWLNSI